ncbi:hypothetical protein SCHPADRAFT_712253 [Schizopora paradoxa]|uniref:Uncharacterized protein n=1 Tax=Schizopora paradoxa TaxID=27342 RepID=A0A0H2R2J3_9AGAM|nr:hypothetical protein SCHPADRAFT_721141 [Schizopora paradoxa]KLO05789.1 hypothetical protein SCHPADRAFT_712253 [Schizopora paradoxa]
MASLSATNMTEPVIIDTPCEEQTMAASESNASATKPKQRDGKRDDHGYPTSLTTEHITWLKKFDDAYLKLPTAKKNKTRKDWFKSLLDDFCKEFPSSKIENSAEKTKAKIGRYFYNLAGKTSIKEKEDDEVKPIDVSNSSLFIFGTKPEVTTALGLFALKNREGIRHLMKQRRTEKGLSTLSNFALYNTIRSEEFKKLSEDKRKQWEKAAKDQNEAAFAAWDKPAEEEHLYRNQLELERVLEISLHGLVGTGRNQVGTSLKVHCEVHLERTDGSIDSYEIHVGRDRFGNEYHESPIYQEMRPDLAWTGWNGHTDAQGKTSSLLDYSR